MNKTFCKKALVTGATCAIVGVLAAAGIAGCSSSSTSGSSSGSSSASGSSTDLAAAYPEHAANAEDGAGLASYHAALGYECADCHTGDLAAEVATLESAADGEEPALTSSYYMDSQVCLDCHGGTWEELAELTSDLGDYNPHDSLHGTIENCNECHKGHSEQVDVCSECHDNGGQTMRGTIE